MTWLARLGWAVLAIAVLTPTVLVLAFAPDVLGLPEPAGATVLDRATFLSGNKPAEDVSLPHAVYPGSGTPYWVRYQIDFDPPVVSDDSSYLLIPLLNRRVVLMMGGETFYDSAYHALWMGPLVNTTALVRLPRQALEAGRNRLVLTVEVDRFIVPVYMPRLYVGTDPQLGPTFNWLSFFEQLKLMSLGAQLLLAVALIVAFFFRPGDTLLAWLVILEVVTAVVAIGMFTGFKPVMRGFLPYFVALAPAYGLLCAVVAVVLLGRRPPRALQLLILTATFVTLACAALGSPFARGVAALIALVCLFAGVFAAIGVIAWGALRRGNPDAWLMLGPSVLVGLFMTRDGYVAVTLPEHPFNMLTVHAGPVYVAAVIAVIMRRLSASLDGLDRANETLTARLAEREAEAAARARQEQIEAGRRAREQERQQLTRDLHDGLSDRLASIIELSERAETRPIAAAAREALDDLHMVIHSLDLGDRDLPLALGNFREHLRPRLQRRGVELDWSMADLPAVSGVTPGKALAVLRILQEAVSNALRHGLARRIAFRGGASPDGMAVLTIENDGRPFVAGSTGRGLQNMRRRAEQLQARLDIKALATGTEVSLLLPRRLGDVEA